MLDPEEMQVIALKVNAALAPIVEDRRLCFVFAFVEEEGDEFLSCGGGSNLEREDAVELLRRVADGMEKGPK